jgi:hypothetical protein
VTVAVFETGTWREGLEALLWTCEEQDLPTGWELGYRVVAATFYGGDPAGADLEPSAEPLSGTGGLAEEAAAFALDTPHVVTPQPSPPRLSNNLAEDVHVVAGLTWAQIAQVFKISERAAAGWRTQGVPPHRQETMEALRAIAVALVGGLGPAGVARWLSVGHPSRLDRITTGGVASVAEEARSYEDTPAT